jgi:hypothetical protein
MEETKKKISLSNVFLTAFIILIIFALAFSFYYFAVMPPPTKIAVTNIVSVQNDGQDAAKKEIQIITERTEIILFSPPEILPEIIKQGDCLASVAQPYRQDAFKCKVLTDLYDPCFVTNQKDTLFCKTNPILGDIVAIKNIKALPTISLPKDVKINWAWFIELEDGTYCSPYIATRPIVDGRLVYYGCKSAIKDQTIVLTGELNNQELLWKAKKAIVVKNGVNWKVQTSEDVDIKTVWQ